MFGENEGIFCWMIHNRFKVQVSVNPFFTLNCRFSYTKKIASKSPLYIKSTWRWVGLFWFCRIWRYWFADFIFLFRGFHPLHKPPVCSKNVTRVLYVKLNLYWIWYTKLFCQRSFTSLISYNTTFSLLTYACLTLG